ncbi:unnamed protein product [Durusdinium trenchii]|uniref:Uncharacterized protein n=1 Tax=Durusdinium trenchii TaxID=1381693 RepID=A0ABP0KVH6_9DINO
MVLPRSPKLRSKAPPRVIHWVRETKEKDETYPAVRQAQRLLPRLLGANESNFAQAGLQSFSSPTFSATAMDKPDSAVPVPLKSKMYAHALGEFRRLPNLQKFKLCNALMARTARPEP